MTLTGIDPATFRFVVQCLNHYATACPTWNRDTVIAMKILTFYGYRNFVTMFTRPRNLSQIKPVQTLLPAQTLFFVREIWASFILLAGKMKFNTQ
jgi:hypothetical protein